MSNYLKHKSGSIEEVIANQSSQKFKNDSSYNTNYNFITLKFQPP